MELMEGGDLVSFLRKNRHRSSQTQQVTEEEKSFVCIVASQFKNISQAVPSADPLRPGSRLRRRGPRLRLPGAPPLRPPGPGRQELPRVRTLAGEEGGQDSRLRPGQGRIQEQLLPQVRRGGARALDGARVPRRRGVHGAGKNEEFLFAFNYFPHFPTSFFLQFPRATLGRSAWLCGRFGRWASSPTLGGRTTWRSSST